jgi:hypothetical protein
VFVVFVASAGKERAALENMQVATPAIVITAEGGRACGSTFAATSLRRYRPASELI